MIACNLLPVVCVVVLIVCLIFPSYNFIKKKVWDGRLLSPLFDTQKYTRDLEALFHRIWRRYEKGLAFDHVSLDKE